MSKFKVGDRVKFLENIYEIGGEGVVCDILRNGIRKLYLCKPDNYYNTLNFYSRELELAIPFTINAGDYIDRYEFTREECERFCEIAVECGFKLQDKHFGQYSYFGVNECGETWACYHADMVGMKNNITTKFREFLDKEKGKMFTKDDLKDGMRIYLEDGATTNFGTSISGVDAFYVCGDEAVLHFPDGGYVYMTLSDLSEDMKTPSGQRVMLITDRDDTVLFEREPEPKEMTVADIERELGYSVKVVK